MELREAGGGDRGDCCGGGEELTVTVVGGKLCHRDILTRSASDKGWFCRFDTSQRLGRGLVRAQFVLIRGSTNS